jgi:hypothetical protein
MATGERRHDDVAAAEHVLRRAVTADVQLHVSDSVEGPRADCCDLRAVQQVPCDDGACRRKPGACHR